MHPLDTRASANDEKIVLATVLFCAVFLSIKYFPGLEGGFYAGFSINAIYPELMANDPVVGNMSSSAGSPYKSTIFYLFPKIFGDIWLDDRFIAGLYILMVATAFLAADRIAVALGAKGVFERITILLFFLKDHQILDNVVIFAHNPDFNHSALALPIGLWLLYAAISGRNLWIVIGLSLLLALVSVQVAPFTAGMALIAAAVIGRRRDRIIVTVLGIGGTAMLLWALFFYIQVPREDWNSIWNQLTVQWYEGMVLPFDTRFTGLGKVLSGNLIFAFILGGVLLWPAKSRPALKATRAVTALSLGALLILGLYGQFAPDGWKVPQLLLFPVARQLQYPQILASIALMVILFRWVESTGGVKQTVVAGLVFLVLLVSGPGNFDLWIGLSALSMAVSLLALYVLWRRQPGFALSPPAPGASVGAFLVGSHRQIICLTFTLTMSVAMAVGAWQKLPAWQFLARTGIHGASENARWIGVTQYIKDNTSIDAVVLPMRIASPNEVRPGVRQSENLVPRRSIASRSGRALPLPLMLTRGLNLKYFEFVGRQNRLLETITTNWMTGNTALVTEAIFRLDLVPDYLVVPSAVVGRMDPGVLPYSAKKEIGGFTVLRRNRDGDVTPAITK